MTKDHFMTASYLLVAVGLFVLAIEMWICGGEAYCHKNNGLAARIAKAAINISVPSYDATTNWSGPANPNFDIELTGNSSAISVPNDGDDGDSDGH